MDSSPFNSVNIPFEISDADLSVFQTFKLSMAPVNKPSIPVPTRFPPILLKAALSPVTFMVLVEASKTPLMYIFTTPVLLLVTATCVHVFKGTEVVEFSPKDQVDPLPKFACSLLPFVIAIACATSLVKISENASVEPFQ